MNTLEQQEKIYNIRVRMRGTSYQADVKIEGKRKQVSSKTHGDAVKKALHLLAVSLESPIKAAVRASTRSERAGTLGAGYKRACVRTWNSDIQKDWKSSRKRAEEILDFFGWHIAPSEITAVKLCTYADYQMDILGRAGSTINKSLSKLRVVLKHCVSLGHCQYIPLFPWCKIDKGRTRFFSLEEERMIVNWFQVNKRALIADFVIVAIDTGCRTGELQKLEWRDVMEDCSHITLRDTKNGQTRRVPLLKRSADIMRERKERGLHMPFEGLSGAKLTKNWKKMRTALGYKDDPEFIPHVMRHTCATRLAMNNTPELKMMLWLGHSTPSMVKRYAHLNVNHLADAVTSLEGYLATA
ncbi:tyrosine-type recombinase/integrase [Candidatus Enterovibrio escicola]|uniref:tyrosine-type recombinase/integrase n=1 Tax=Candidatus Enterovibrio escicola TaxID=1927127 RepID=UPI001237B4DB|nr:site-specific integrase [Candidatus Enterovibrio escacola]